MRTYGRSWSTPGTSVAQIPDLRLGLKTISSQIGDLRYHVLVILLVLRNDLVRAETLGRVPAPRLAHAVMQVLIRQQRHHPRRLRGDVSHFFQEPVFAIGDQLRHSAHARGYR